MAEITVTITSTPAQAIEFLRLLARDDGPEPEAGTFRRLLAEEPITTLKRYGITIQSTQGLSFSTSLPPKHAVEEALVNVKAANEFGPDTASEEDPPLGYWPFLAFLATTDS
jgi:hypothetical protein